MKKAWKLHGLERLVSIVQAAWGKCGLMTVSPQVRVRVRLDAGDPGDHGGGDRGGGVGSRGTSRTTPCGLHDHQ